MCLYNCLTHPGLRAATAKRQSGREQERQEGGREGEEGELYTCCWPGREAGVAR